MLIVETIAKIRRAFFVQGKPIKAICRELGVHLVNPKTGRSLARWRRQTLSTHSGVYGTHDSATRRMRPRPHMRGVALALLSQPRVEWRDEIVAFPRPAAFAKCLPILESIPGLGPAYRHREHPGRLRLDLIVA